MDIDTLLADLYMLKEYLSNYELELAESLLSEIVEEVEIFNEDSHKDGEDVEYDE